ncbi:MAG: DUF433 domain-containing protein [Chloroflexota bacterium]
MMAGTKTDHPRVVRVDGVLGGQPVVDGSRVSVTSIARFLNDGVPPEEIVGTYPHLGEAAVYDAISYYFDHQSEIDRLIAESTPDALQRRYEFTIEDEGRIRFENR